MQSTDCFHEKGRNGFVILASLPMWAAQRLSKLIGKEAMTIHRLLELDPSKMRFKRNSDVPLLVIGEASMLDLFFI